MTELNSHGYVFVVRAPSSIPTSAMRKNYDGSRGYSMAVPKKFLTFSLFFSYKNTRSICI
jgi:hypothetical protein